MGWSMSKTPVAHETAHNFYALLHRGARSLTQARHAPGAGKCPPRQALPCVQRQAQTFRHLSLVTMGTNSLPLQRRLKTSSTLSSVDSTGGPVSPASPENDPQGHCIAEQPQMLSHCYDVPTQEIHAMSKSPTLGPGQFHDEIGERRSMIDGRSLMPFFQIPDGYIHRRNHSRLRALAPRFLRPRMNITERSCLSLRRRGRLHWDLFAPLVRPAPPPLASTYHGWRMPFASAGARWPRRRMKSSASRSSSRA